MAHCHRETWDMHFLDLTLPSLAENLALDEALLPPSEERAGAEWLRIWEWPAPAVILGAGCSLLADVNETACTADNVPILRRSSGGGTVLLGRGCLLFSLVLPYERAPELAHIGPSYRFILDRICRSLAVPGLQCAGISDLALAGRKVSGNAQQRKRTHLLHHGTLLYAFDLTLVERYLRLPARQPDYRQQRPHTEFLTNLPLDRQTIVERLRQVFGADEETAAWPGDLVRQLVETKYGRPKWTRRR
jgi:lipoate-protein ligase A